VVEKSKEAEAIWRVEALREVLKEIHSLFVMFYGPVREMLEKDPSGGQIRAHLYPFVMDYLSGKALCYCVGWNCSRSNFCFFLF
jgi:hypothetical protein